MRVKLPFELFEWWASTALYCPQCGAQDVWMAEDGHDEYAGDNIVCASCGSEFYYRQEPGPSADLIEALKARRAQR